MPIVKDIDVDEDSRIGVWKIDETIEELKWQLQWGQKDIEQFSLIKNDEKCLHWLSSRVLLRKMLNTCKFIDLQMDENGKPYLGNSTTHLSITHSGKYVAVILSNKGVGIDIQEPKESLSLVVSKFMTEEEIETLDDSPKKEELLLAYWTAKEALYKLTGKKKVDYKGDLQINNIVINGDKGGALGTIDIGSAHKEILVNYIRIEDYLLAYVINEE